MVETSTKVQRIKKIIFSILEKKEIKYKLINRTESITDISKKIGIDRRTAGRIINELIWKEIVL